MVVGETAVVVGEAVVVVPGYSRRDSNHYNYAHAMFP